MGKCWRHCQNSPVIIPIYACSKYQERCEEKVHKHYRNIHGGEPLAFLCKGCTFFPNTKGYSPPE